MLNLNFSLQASMKKGDEIENKNRIAFHVCRLL